MLPSPEGSTVSSGAESVKTLFEMADVNEKVEPAHELKRVSESHARIHPHVRLNVPHGYEAAMDWLDAAQAKHREGNAALSGAELDNLNPPHREVLDLLLTGKEMIRRVRPSLQQDAHGPVKMGFLALVVAHCAIHGARHFDHFFDRARHGHLVSPSSDEDHDGAEACEGWLGAQGVPHVDERQLAVGGSCESSGVQRRDGG
mmetsp:Transcript_2159/g.4309  ORF Transcript_2159/g.4309 Transcript_2159/m.4309 type:complete len:202 (-) Transcript_2159:536-1141(-)